MNIRHLSLLCIVGLVLIGCAGNADALLAETRSIASVTRVSLDGFGELQIVQGDRESLTIEAEPRIMRRIETTVIDDTLRIGLRTGLLLQVIPTRDVRYYLTVVDLDHLRVGGLGQADVAALETDTLTIDQSGAGRINLRSLTAETLSVQLTGVGVCDVSGQVAEQDVTITGWARYGAGELKSERASIRVTGLASARVWSIEYLEGDVSGVGIISYHGDPELSENVSGVGRVRSIGQR